MDPDEVYTQRALRIAALCIAIITTVYLLIKAPVYAGIAGLFVLLFAWLVWRIFAKRR